MMKNWKYLLFVLVGIISFIIGFDFFGVREKILLSFEKFSKLPDISGLLEFFLSFLIMIILFFIFLFISKERTVSFAIKSFSISLLTLMILFFLFFSLSALNRIVYLNVERIEEKDVMSYINLTNDELENFPSLKNAIETIFLENKTEYSSKISQEEGGRINKFLKENVNTIKYSGFYFRIRISYAD